MLEEQRLAKAEHDNERAQATERANELRERIRTERQDSMVIDADGGLPSLDQAAHDQIEQLTADLEAMERDIDEKEKRHQASCDIAINKLVEKAKELQEA